MNLPAFINSNYLHVEAFAKTIPMRVIGMTLSYCVFKKIAQIVKTKFPDISTAHLPYVGLVTGAFAYNTLSIVIYAVALCILIPLSEIVSKGKTGSKVPSDLEDMQATMALKDQHYMPLEKETKKIAVFINNSEKSNVMIIGSAGSGKTALVESIIQRVCKMDSTLPKGLLNKKFYRVSCVSLMSGTSYRGSLEKKIDEILKFAKSQKNNVIIFDEIHQLAISNKDKDIPILDFFKADLARGGISIIGMTTKEEFEKHLNDPALQRRFNVISLKTPSFADSLKMLEKRTEKLLKEYPNITIIDNTIYKEILDLAQNLLHQTSSLVDQGYNILQTVFTVVDSEEDPELEQIIDKEKIKRIGKDYFDMRPESSILHEEHLA